jgi:hypothetical protein
MKVTNWRRKLMESLVAGGLLVPTAVQAADLNTNLVANPGFESVDMAVTGDYNAPAVQVWLGGPGFAYSHNPTVTTIPDYADGDDPPNAGSWYFTSNNNPGSTTGDWRAPDLVYQDIDVSAGSTGSQIAIGEAAYRLSAFMSSYLNDNDAGNVQIDFKNAGGTAIGSAIISDPDFGPNNVWSLSSTIGLMPVGVASIRVSLFGTPRNGGADGYIDNVDVRLVPAANELLFLEVNTGTGQVAIKNQTGEPVNIDYYEVESAAGTLNPTAWNSLQEQNLPGFPAGNGSGNGWEQFGGSSASVLGESTLTGASRVANDATVSLGAAYNAGGARDLVFRYGAVAGASAALSGDYNENGVVDAADYTVWRNNVNQSVTIPNDTTPGTVSQEDYNVWRANFGLSGSGSTGPSTLMQGFVRYVGPVAAASAVPEPSSVLLIGIGIASLGAGSRRRL